MLWWKQVTLECETSNSNPASSLQWVATPFLLLYRLMSMTWSHHIGLCEYFDSYLNSDRVLRLRSSLSSTLHFWYHIVTSSVLIKRIVSPAPKLTLNTWINRAFGNVSVSIQTSRQLLDALTSKQTELSLIINPPSSFFVLQNCPKWGQLICRAAKSLKYFFCFRQTRSAGTMS